MILWVFVLNSVLVCAVTSLVQCAEPGDVAYISEMMLLCKRGEHAFVPWLCFLAFAAIVFVQLTWMEQVATVWFRVQVFCERFETDSRYLVTALNPHLNRGQRIQQKSALANWGSRTSFMALAVTAVVGFGFVVGFDWRDAGAVHSAMHRVGVVLLAFGGFGTLQVVWMTLRGGDSVSRLRGGVDGHGTTRDVPYLSWIEIDVVFVIVLFVFMVTTLVGGHPTMSAIFEYVAFGILMIQTTWLFVLCWERDRWLKAMMGHGDDIDKSTAGRVLWVLLAAYVIEAGIVLLFCV